MDSLRVHDCLLHGLAAGQGWDEEDDEFYPVISAATDTAQLKQLALALANAASLTGALNTDQPSLARRQATLRCIVSGRLGSVRTPSLGPFGAAAMVPANLRHQSGNSNGFGGGKMHDLEQGKAAETAAPQMQQCYQQQLMLMKAAAAAAAA